MALLFGNDDGTYKNTCPICSEPLSKPVFATSHFIADEANPLWRFSDAGMHWECYAHWPERESFARQYFDTVTKYELTNPYWPTVLRHPDVVVRANLDTMQCLDIDVRSIGPAPRVDASDWTAFLRGELLGDCVHDCQRSALTAIIPIIREALPTIAAVRAAANETAGEQ